LVVDVVEPRGGVPHVWADLDAQRADEALSAHGPVHGAIFCPELGRSRPDLLDRWLDATLRAVGPTGLVVGVAAASAATEPRASLRPEWRGDLGVLRLVGSLDDRAAPVRSCLILHSRLVPAFDDCRGETHEISGEPGELERSHVGDAMRFVLSLSPDVLVRQLILEAPAPAPNAAAEPVSDGGQPVSPPTARDREGS
jgi:hypothetical protein